MLNHIAFLVAHAVHQSSNALRLEQAHEVVFQRHIKLRSTWITLTSGTTPQLAVYPARFVAFGTDDGQTTRSFHLVVDLDVGTPSCHVGGDGYFAGAACFGHNFCFPLVLLGVEYVVVNVAHAEQTAQFFGNIHRSCTHQYGATRVAEAHNFVNHCIVFLLGRFEHQIIHVLTGHGAVGWDNGYLQFVDVPQFFGFGFSSTGHTRQLVVHAEEVLEGNRGIGLGDFSHLDVFLGFQGLVQTVRIPAAFHHPASLFIYNLDLTFHDDIIFVNFEDGVSLEQLTDGV